MSIEFLAVGLCVCTPSRFKYIRIFVCSPEWLSVRLSVCLPASVLTYPQCQALKRDSSNAETYYKRAALFEEKGDILLALEDYTIANKLCPSNTVAILKKGKYNFERG